MGCRYVDYLNFLIFADHKGNRVVVRLRVLSLALSTETLSRPRQGRARVWKGLSGDQRRPFKDTACYTGKVLGLGYLGPGLD